MSKKNGAFLLPKHEFLNNHKFKTKPKTNDAKDAKDKSPHSKNRRGLCQ